MVDTDLRFWLYQVCPRRAVLCLYIQVGACVGAIEMHLYALYSSSDIDSDTFNIILRGTPTYSLSNLMTIQ